MKNVKAIATAEDGSVDELAGDDNIVTGACVDMDDVRTGDAIVIVIIANLGSIRTAVVV